MRMCPNLFSWCLLLGVASGCAANSPTIIREDSYTVSVKANGVAQKDFNRQLVHRINVKASELKLMKSSGADGVLLPFSFEYSFDLNGKPSGLKIKTVKSYTGVNSLGIEQGDLITAFGFSPPTGARDFWNLFLSLEKNKQVSITLQRRGRPHKILYYLEN